MKHMKHWLMTVAVLLCSVVVNAYDFEVDGIYYNIIDTFKDDGPPPQSGIEEFSVLSDYDNGRVEVTYGSSIYSGTYSGAIDIPSTVTYNGTTYDVTSIGDEAFYECQSLISLTIPECLTSIGKYAFFNCVKLKSVDIPNNSKLTSLGEGAFDCCFELTSIDIPNGVTSIENLVFSYCSSIASITIPENVISIGKSAFQSCSKLSTVIIPNNVVSIGQYAFSRCGGLSSIIIGSSVTSIGSEAFRYCSSLTSITCKSVIPPSGYDAFGQINKSIPVYVPAASLEAYKAAEGWSEFTNIQPIAGIISSGTCGDNITWELTEEGELIIEGTGDMENYSPRQSPWFGNRTLIKKISMGSGITSVGEYAFYGLTELLSIDFSDDVKSIGMYAFCGCEKLIKIELPTKLTSINYRAFSKCSSLVSVEIPELVTSIGDCSFEQCTAIKTVSLPENLVKIGEMAFYLCESIESLVIPSNVKAIGRQAFSGCSSMASVVLSNKLNDIYDYAFAGCESLTSVIIPKSVTSIGDCAFSDCSNLASIIVEAGNQKYDSRDDCNAIIETSSNTLISGFSATKIPNTVTSIGELAFNGQTNLTSIIIPQSVISIGNGAFNRCSGLTSITCEAETPPTIVFSSMYAFDNVDRTIPVYVPASSVDAYKAEYYWNVFTNIQAIPIASGTCGDNLTWVLTNEYELIIEGTGAMTEVAWTKYMGNINTVTIKEGVTNILSTAFNSCGMTSITIPESVANIGDGAFANCQNLTSINIPANVISIGAYLTVNCECLKSITVAVENSVYDSREGCNAIIETNSNTLIAGCTATVIPTGVVGIGNGAFAGLDGLTSIVIPQSVTNIGNEAFSKCSGLTSITCHAEISPIIGYGKTFENVDKSIPVYVPTSSIDAYKAANGWKEFTNIQPILKASGICGDNLTWKVTEEGELIIEGTGDMYNYLSSGSAPWYTYGVKKITIKEGVTSIGRGAFYRLRSLTSVSIPGSVKVVGASAFNFCEGLRSIVIPEGVTTIEGSAFASCDVLYSITIPTTLKTFGQTVFASDCRGRNVKISSLEAWCNISFSGSYSNPLDCDGYGGTLILNGEIVKELVIPCSITEVKSMAFRGCYDIKTITIHEGVTKIGSSAFDCYPTAITCLATTPPTCDSYTFNKVGEAIPVYVPKTSVSTYQTATGWKNFTNIQPILSKKEILDNTESFSQAEDEDFDVITYKRTFSKVNTWYALYLPFEIPVTEEFSQNYEVGYFNDIHSYDEYIGDMVNGVKGSDGEIDRMTMEVLTVQQGATLNANYPYLIRVKNANALNMELKVEDATIYRTVETTVSCSSVFMRFDVTGIYTAKTAGELKGEHDVYAVSGGGWKVASNESDKVRPFRLYLKLTSISGSPVKVSESAMKAISIRVNGEEGTTAIDETELTFDNAESVVYDMQGRRVVNPGKGMYIVNGKKVIFK